MRKREYVNVGVDPRRQGAEIRQLCDRWHVGVKKDLNYSFIFLL